MRYQYKKELTKTISRDFTLEHQEREVEEVISL
jgi:hypothetical protein